MRVPNQPPAEPPGATRLAIVAECPGLEEETCRTCPQGHVFPGESWHEGRRVTHDYCPDCGSTAWRATPTPLVGPSGRLLNALLRDAGLPRRQVWVGNVSQEALSAMQLENPEHPTVAAGLADLRQGLGDFHPTCVLCLGNTALRAFHPLGWKRNKKREFAAKVTDWRGSIFEGWGYKCVAAYHPAACLRQPEWTPMLRFDLERAVEEARTPGLNPPTRYVEVVEDAPTLLAKLGALHLYPRVAFDIEGYPGEGVTDCSFAERPDRALWVPFKRVDGSPWWSPSDEHQIRAAVAALLQDDCVLKVMHNTAYELFVMKWAHGVDIRGIGGDTMLLWHEAYCELDKALEVAASVMTRQPYWKYGRGAETEAERAQYNGTDSMVTFELEQALLAPGVLTPGQLAHYHHRLSLLEAVNFQMQTGFRFDVEARDKLVAGLWADIYGLQGELDELAGICAPTFEEVVARVCNKNKAKFVTAWADVPTYANNKWRDLV